MPLRLRSQGRRWPKTKYRRQMKRRFHRRKYGQRCKTATADGEAIPSELTANQVARWAELIADDREEFPRNLSRPDYERRRAG